MECTKGMAVGVFGKCRQGMGKWKGNGAYMRGSPASLYIGHTPPTLMSAASNCESMLAVFKGVGEGLRELEAGNSIRR